MLLPWANFAQESPVTALAYELQSVAIPGCVGAGAAVGACPRGVLVTKIV